MTLIYVIKTGEFMDKIWLIPAIVVGLTFWEVHFASDENIAAGHVKKGKRSMKFEICLSFES